jgi:hypothetical protein
MRLSSGESTGKHQVIDKIVESPKKEDEPELHNDARLKSHGWVGYSGNDRFKGNKISTFAFTVLNIGEKTT